MKLSKKYIFLIAFLLCLGFFLIPHFAFAQARTTRDILTTGLIQPPSGEDYEIADFFFLLAAVIRLAFSFTAVIAVIYLIMGGYNYVTAYGNPEVAQKGKSTITNAIIGLIISIVSFALVQFIWNSISSENPPHPTAGTSSPPGISKAPPGGGGHGGGTAIGNIILTFTGDNNSITLNWTAPANATHYTIYKDDAYLVGQTTTSYKDMNVKTGQKYEYTVYAFDASESQVGDATDKTVTKTATGVK